MCFVATAVVAGWLLCFVFLFSRVVLVLFPFFHPIIALSFSFVVFLIRVFFLLFLCVLRVVWGLGCWPALHYITFLFFALVVVAVVIA